MVTRRTLTDRQKNLFRCIVKYQKEHGFSPSVRDLCEIYVYGACATEGTGRKWVYREDEGVPEGALCKGEGVISVEKRRVWLTYSGIGPAGLSALMRGDS